MQVSMKIFSSDESAFPQWPQKAHRRWIDSNCVSESLRLYTQIIPGSPPNASCKELLTVWKLQTMPHKRKESIYSNWSDSSKKAIPGRIHNGKYDKPHIWNPPGSKNHGLWCKHFRVIPEIIIILMVTANGFCIVYTAMWSACTRRQLQKSVSGWHVLLICKVQTPPKKFPLISHISQQRLNIGKI